MKELFERILNEYVNAKKETFAKHPMGTVFRHDIPEMLLKTKIVESDEYKVVGSTGQGNWACIPWVAILDKSADTDIKSGDYVVYLLSENGETLYLTLNQGCTELKKREGKQKTLDILRQKADEIISKVDSRGFEKDKKIYLTDNKAEPAIYYEAGTSFYKAYHRGAVPEEEELRDDLRKMMDIYKEYEGKKSVHETGRFDSWDIVSDDIAVKHCDKSFYEHNGSGIPKKICWFFDADNLNEGETVKIVLRFKSVEYQARISNESSDRRRVRIFWYSDLSREFIKYKISDQAISFKRVAQGIYEVDFIKEEKEDMTVNTKETLESIKYYISSRGFDYPDGLIENFYLGLKSKPFVILAGTSGTGKTRLVKLFAEAIGAEYKLVSVRPDWSDGSDLFGHTDLNGNFIPGPVCPAFEAAIKNPDKPVLLCLDEMNLARVEYYLSDFLSVIESREKKDGHVVTDAIAQYKNGIPDNLYIIGTVNMDETTFPFSKKVLDRANTIEFNYVDLIPKKTDCEAVTPQNLPNSFLQTEYLVLAKDCMDEEELVDKICKELAELNEKLKVANAHVGYRVRDEIVFYMLNNKKSGELLTYEQAMDNEIMQKILPRIQGSSTAIKELLIDMFKFCMGSASGIDADTGNVGKHMKDAAGSAKYPESAKKIGYMMTRFEDDGFTSYWL